MANDGVRRLEVAWMVGIGADLALSVILLVVASPVIKVRLGLADAGTAPKNQTTRKAYDLLSTGFGPGFTEPIPVVTALNSDHNAAVTLQKAFRHVPGIAHVVHHPTRPVRPITEEKARTAS